MNKHPNPIYITQPLLADKTKVHQLIDEIWATKQLTNMGPKHNLLEKSLEQTLKVANVSLFNNGHIALDVAIKALNLPAGSEVITTPFTFASTPHAISLNNLKPIFCDIKEDSLVIDDDKIESLITANTKAIVGVHVYGFACNVYKIDEIAKKHNLKVIYDAAHAFSTEIDGRGIGSFGDITMFSFHATKLFNTIEGGCLTYNDSTLKPIINKYKNFGIISEEIVECAGLNGKMNEIQAGIGLLNLEIFEAEKAKRERVRSFYNSQLQNIDGITIPTMPNNISNSYQYYPIIIDTDKFGMSRNDLYAKLKEHNIMARKYFYPACSDFDCYKDLPSAQASKLPITTKLKTRVLCLPYYGDLTRETLEFICKLITS